MAFVRDTAFTAFTSNTTSFTVGLPDDYATGDTLVLFVVKDSDVGGLISTPAGWTSQESSGTGASITTAIFYKENVTAASETDPVVTNTDSDTWIGICVAVGGVPTSSVIDASTSAILTVSSAEVTYTGVTTTVDDSLVLHAFAGGSTYGSMLDDSLIRTVSDPGVTSESLQVYEETMFTAGASSNGICFYGVDFDLWAASIALKDGSSGAEINPRQLSGGLVDVLNLFQAVDTETYNPSGVPSGITTDAGTTYGTINTLAATSLAGNVLDSADRNFFASLKGMAIVNPRQSVLSYSGARFELDRSGGGATYDLSGSDTVIAYGTFVASLANILQMKDIGLLGAGVVLEDDVGNWKAWSVFAKNSSRVMSSPEQLSVLLDPSNTDTVDSSGTLDLTKLKYIGFIMQTDNIFSSSLISYQTSLIKIEPIVIGGGSSTRLIDIAYMTEVAEANNQRFISTAGNSSTILGKWIFGDASVESHVTIDGKGINIPSIGNDDVMLTVDGYNGFKWNASANCVFNFTSNTVDGGSEWEWNQITGSGTQNYTGNIFVNSKPITLGAADYTGTTFRNCATVTQNGATLDSCIIDNSMDSSGAVLDIAGSFTGLTAKNCTVGVEFTAAGTVDLDGMQFEGNTTDLEFSGTGTLNVRVTNGADTPTTTATGGGTVNVVQVPAEITFENLTTANVQIIEDDGTTVASRQTNQTGTVVYQIPDGSTGTWCYVINRAGYQPLIGNVLSTGSDVTVDGTQTQKKLPDGTAMYQGSTSVLLSVVPLADGSRMNLRIADGAVSAQQIFDEVEDALQTQDGMTYLCNNNTGEVLIALLPTGTFVFLDTNVRVIRDNVGDANATINAFVESTDGIVLDASNGSVQFVIPNSDVNIVSVNDVATTGVDDFKADLSGLPTDVSISDAVWEENVLTHLTAGTTGLNMALAGGVIVDTVATGTPASTTIQLTAGSSVDDYYNDMVLFLFSGPSAGTSRPIFDYDGTTKTITIDEPFPVLPTNGDRIVVKTTHEHPISQIGEAVRVEMDANSTQLAAIVTDTGTDIPAQISGLNNISPAEVNTEVDTALSDYDAPTKAELDSAVAPLATEVNATTNTNSIITEVDANETKIDLLETKAQADTRQTALITEHTTTQSDIAALNNLSTADIDARLAAYGLPTLTQITAAFTEIKGAGWTTGDTLEAISGAIATGGISAADVWSYGTREVTGGTIDTNNDMRGTDGANTVTPPTATQIQNAISGTDFEKILKRSGLIPALL